MENYKQLGNLMRVFRYFLIVIASVFLFSCIGYYEEGYYGRSPYNPGYYHGQFYHQHHPRHRSSYDARHHFRGGDDHHHHRRGDHH